MNLKQTVKSYVYIAIPEVITKSIMQVSLPYRKVKLEFIKINIQISPKQTEKEKQKNNKRSKQKQIIKW